MFIYILIFSRIVENRIKKILPKLFAIIFDGWDQDGSGIKYIAVFASFMHNSNPKKGIYIYIKNVHILVLYFFIGYCHHMIHLSLLYILSSMHFNYLTYSFAWVLSSIGRRFWFLLWITQKSSNSYFGNIWQNFGKCLLPCWRQL